MAAITTMLILDAGSERRALHIASEVEGYLRNFLLSEVLRTSSKAKVQI
jgi:hypothetical protein